MLHRQLPVLKHARPGNVHGHCSPHVLRGHSSLGVATPHLSKGSSYILETIYPKQSPREWYNTPKEFLESLGFHYINAVLVNCKKKLIVTAYVDSVLIIGPKSTAEIPKLKKDELEYRSSRGCVRDVRHRFSFGSFGTVWRTTWL